MSFFNYGVDLWKDQSTAKDLNNRLIWGEPALSILDVREGSSFYKAHVMGAISMPVASLVEKARDSFESYRNLYVYGSTDEETNQAAAALRSAGFVCVAELKGGLESWKKSGYPVEEVN